MRLLACSASVAFNPAQANCLSLGEINSSQLVVVVFMSLLLCVHAATYSSQITPFPVLMSNIYSLFFLIIYVTFDVSSH
jgi:hypothetical protein